MNDKEKKNVLILSANFGDGHKQVANAINESIEYSLPNVEPIMVDIMEWVHPNIYQTSYYVYKEFIKKLPRVYGYFYRKTQVKSIFSNLLNSLFSFGMRSMLEIIQRTQPTVIVSTYPFAAGIISKLKEHGLIDIPAVTIVTDYSDHSCWIHSLTDEYVVGSKQVREQLISHGVESCKITDTGIPVRYIFNQFHSREPLAIKYGLDPEKFTLLVMGGGDGFIGKGLSTLQSLESISDSLQVIIVCGRNNKLRDRLEAQLATSKHEILLMGYCRDIHELMAISDLMISKPGGVTTSEAMAMELPLLIYKPLPGQEEDNTDYLLGAGLAFFARDEIDLLSKVQTISRDSKQLELMKQRTTQFQTKNASLAALDAIVSTINRCEQENATVYPAKIIPA